MFCQNKEEAVKAGYNNIPAYAYNNFDPTTGKHLGKFYNVAAIRDPRGLAPIGWKIASSSDWASLFKAAGYNQRELKSKSGWLKGQFDPDDCIPKGTDKYGFNALPTSGIWTNKSEWNYTEWFT